MDKRLSGPAYLYDDVNRERGGLITRQTLVKKDPYNIGGMSSPVGCMGDTPGNTSTGKVDNKDGAAFRVRL